MIKNDRQLGKPLGLFQNTKDNIEALTGLTGGEIAYATDTGEDGVYDAVTAGWVWGRGSGTLPSTTAENDFIVGSPTIGTWIKKTLTETKTILGVFADAASDSIYYVRRNAAWTNLKTYTDTLYAIISHTHTYSDVILAYASGTSTVSAGGTMYFFPHLTSYQSGIGAIIYPTSGTMKNMAVRLSSAQPASGSLVITLLKNLGATGLSITIPAGAAGGTTHTNTTNTVTWNAFDLLSWKIVNNATATSGSVPSFTMTQNRTTT